MQKCFVRLAGCPQSNVTVLLTGESAAARKSSRVLCKAQPARPDAVIALNMAAIPRDLLDERTVSDTSARVYGCHGNATRPLRAGRGERCFLDEIGDMPSVIADAVVARVSDGTYYRVGGDQPIKAERA